MINKSNIAINVAGVNDGKTFSGDITVSHGLSTCEGVRLEMAEGQEGSQVKTVHYLSVAESMDLVRAILVVLREKREPGNVI